METGTTISGGVDRVVLDSWTARKVPPIVMLYVVVVFLPFMVLAYFVFHSLPALKALAITAFGTIVALVPTIMEKVEYQLTEAGLQKRSANEKKTREFTTLFGWDELSHVIPTKRGFKYFKTLNESSPLRRFWKIHMSDAYSGEVHIEPEDLGRVSALLTERGVRGVDG